MSLKSNAVGAISFTVPFFITATAGMTQINGLDPVISHSKNLPITEDGIINRENKSIIINNR